jgi:hypothetical protein
MEAARVRPQNRIGLDVDRIFFQAEDPPVDSCVIA